MSLIQQALEKTNREQEAKTANPLPASRTYDRDPMGATLEQELTQVQQSYAKRRGFYWKVSLGVLLVCFIAGLSYVGFRQIPSDMKPALVAVSAPVASQIPIKISSGNIYRLTGISDLGGNAIAVINGRLLGVGDSPDGKAVVRAIGNGEVRLDVHGKEVRLTL